ncbi:MAG TPA: L,D-transpeptidase family protein [Gammaproteobacteria bacterium]|nr:L,D-transpeptidase family protein [Gammaproteobacteria bacterium]
MKLNKTVYIILILCSTISAREYTITNSTAIVGDISSLIINTPSSLEKIARDTDSGFDELIAANPSLHTERILPGTVVVVPSQYILPKRNPPEVVINLPEKRLYYFPSAEKVFTFPVGVGRVSWNSPEGLYKITQKQKNPIWYIPEAVRKEEALKGNFLPKTLPPGPENPLGKYKMRLSHTSFLIHGTNRPDTVGKRSTAGCFSLYPKDIEKFFPLVNTGTKVRIINKPIKIHMNNQQVFLESHHPLKHTANDELLDMTINDIHVTFDNLIKVIPKSLIQHIDPEYIKLILTENLGIPQPLAH